MYEKRSRNRVREQNFQTLSANTRREKFADFPQSSLSPVSFLSFLLRFNFHSILLKVKAISGLPPALIDLKLQNLFVLPAAAEGLLTCKNAIFNCQSNHTEQVRPCQVSLSYNCEYPHNFHLTLKRLLPSQFYVVRLSHIILYPRPGNHNQSCSAPRILINNSQSGKPTTAAAVQKMISGQLAVQALRQSGQPRPGKDTQQDMHKCCKALFLVKSLFVLNLRLLVTEIYATLSQIASLIKSFLAGIINC